jgi:hypothetical protein
MRHLLGIRLLGRSGRVNKPIHTETMKRLEMTGKRTGKTYFAFRMVPEEFQSLDDDNCGLCIRCGEITVGCVEPDARAYECEACETKGVYGAQELLIMGLINLTEEGGEECDSI